MGRPFASLPAEIRPRERLLAHGREVLSDAELLALQLRSGTRGSSASDLAADLLAEFGDLRGLGSATIEEVATIPGVGYAKAASIVAGFELGRRVTAAFPERIRLATASDVATVAQRSIGGLRREHVLVLVCDRRGILLRQVQLSTGTDHRAVVDVREVLNAVLRHDGASFAIAHNHPSGDPQPSGADLDITTGIATGAKTVGLRFLGHVVVTDSAWAEVALRPNQRMLD